MEFVQKYWWIFLGLIAVMFLTRGKAAGGPTVTQIGSDGSAWAQINVQADQADQESRYGLIGSLLNWDLAGRQLQSNEALSRAGLQSGERIAAINAESAAAAAASQSELSRYGYNIQQQMAQLQAQTQLAALRRQSSAQTQSNLFGLLGTGLQTFLPLIFGGGRSSGGWGSMGTPTTFPSGHGGGRGGFWGGGW